MFIAMFKIQFGQRIKPLQVHGQGRSVRSLIFIQLSNQYDQVLKLNLRSGHQMNLDHSQIALVHSQHISLTLGDRTKYD